MGVDTVVNMMDALRSSQLLDADQLHDVHQNISTRFDKPVDLARELVARGWLTRYQAQQLLQGHGSQLELGAYRLLERLGEGGMGQVYKALHQPMNRIVALKIVRPELLQDPRTLKRFRREVQAAAQLSHPNIVTVFDADQVGNLHFLAMEFIDGEDLADIVRETGPLPVSMACDYIRQAALGLQHAHERGIVHRDIKPSNLLVTRSHPERVVKILDMGLARPVKVDFGNQKQKSSVTIDGTVVGTPDFMAPEQAKSSNSVDHRADIYSLGCTFYFLLTARMPFPDVLPMEKLIKHQLEHPYPVELLRNDVPGPVLQVLQAMLAKSPAERPESADVAAALSPFCMGATHVPSASDQSQTTQFKAPSLGRPDSEPIDPVPAGTVVSSPFDFNSEPTAAKEAPHPAKPNRTKWLVLSTIGGAILVLCIIGLLWIIRVPVPKIQPTTPTHAFAPEPTVPPQSPEELLAASIPDEATAIFVVRAGPLFQAQSIQIHAKPALAPVFQFLQLVQVDPYRQLDRIIVSTTRDNPEQFLAVMLGDYVTPDFRKVLETKLIPEEVAWPDRSTDLIYRLTNPQKGQTSFLAILQQRFLAVASDRAILQKAYVRFQDRKRINGNDTLRKLLAGSKSDATIRMAASPQFLLGDKALEHFGI